MHLDSNDVDFFERLKNVQFHPSKRPCPECKIEVLNTYLISIINIEVDICPSYNGMYFDRGELRRFAPYAKKNRSGKSETDLLWSETIDGEQLLEDNPTLNRFADFVCRLTWILSI